MVKGDILSEHFLTTLLTLSLCSCVGVCLPISVYDKQINLSLSFVSFVHSYI